MWVAARKFVLQNKVAIAYFFLFLGFGIFALKWNGVSWRQGVINSDGRGYYYFLPAMESSDFSYAGIQELETKHIGKSSQPYLLNTENGRKINKCYPGVAIMQLPSYLVASAVDFLQGEQANPYSETHLYFFFWTTILFLFIGLLYLKKSLEMYFNSSKNTWIAAVAAIIFTNVGYQAYFYPGITHHYTFVLFSLWIYHVLRWKQSHLFKHLMYLGVVTGMLMLVRPTNAMIVVFLPFLLQDWQSVQLFFRKLFGSGVSTTLLVISSFLVVIALLPILTYAQTGNFFYWSYQGEGFRWNDTHWIETWFSYRAGIFVHTPLVLFGLVAFVWRSRSRLFQVWTLLLGYAIVSFVLSAWWCWDYQLFFGHRGFTEYQIFTGFLVIYLLNLSWKSAVGFGLFLIAGSYMGIRTFQKITSIYPVQKFTASTYWKSLLDFDTSIEGKYVFFVNCQPYGKVVFEQDLMLDKSHYQILNGSMQFFSSNSYHVPERFAKKRIFVEMHCNKRRIDSEDWKEVHVIFVGTDANDSLVHYAGYPLYHYYKEGKEEWIGYNMAEEYHLSQDNARNVSVYLWNQGDKSYEIDDFQVKLKVLD